ncbi:MAG TPA: ABC transporter permease [Pseudolabrys sp.]|nr:ABC transporter permease [Pseudolabrys sp.]
MTDAIAISKSADTSDAAELPHKILKARRLRTTKQIVLGVGFPLFLLLLWELAARIGLIDQRFFPAPSRVASGMVALLSDPDERARLLFDIGATYQRLALGYVIGSVLGIVTGVAMGLSINARFALGPLVNATFPTPKLAIFPLLIVIFGLGDASKVALIAFGVFYMTCLSTLSGVLYSNPLHRDVAQAFRIPAWTRWSRIVVPAALPSIVTGLKLGLGQALILVVSAEFVAADRGLGQFIWDSWQVLDVSRMFVGLVVVALTGGAAVLLGEILERRLIPWSTH